MMGEHMLLLAVSDLVLIASQACEHQSHPSEVLEDMIAHVALDVNEVIVDLARTTISARHLKSTEKNKKI